MRLLFWTREFWPGIGGVEVLAAKLVPELRRRGYEILVVTPGDRVEEGAYQGIPVYRFPFRNYEHYASIERLAELRNQVAKVKRDFRPDLVHVNSLDVGDFFHITTSQVSPCPYLVTLHGEWPISADGKNSLVEKTLKGARWIAGCSQATLDFARRLVPEITANSSVIYNGRETPALAVHPLPLSPPIVLCLGRLVKEKGFDVALTAFAAVAARFPAARMVIAGDGPVRSELERQVTELGLCSVVEFVGWVEPDAVPEVVNSATLAVVASRWDEPFGLVALEAALMGRPVVATRGGGLPEVVLDGVTGVLVDKENSQAMADAILDLLRHPETAARMGRAARRRAIQIFGWDRFVDAYDELYQSLAAREKVSLQRAVESPRLYVKPRANLDS